MRRILTGNLQVSSNKYSVQQNHWLKLSPNWRNSTGSMSIVGITRPIPPSSFGIRRKNGPPRYCWNYYLSHGICGRIVLASNLKLPNAAGKFKNRRRKKYVRVFTLPRRNTVQHHGKSSFADHTDRNKNDILSACHVFVGSTVWIVKEDFKEIRAYTLKSQSQIRDQPLFW